jgi:hypothetical protein
MGLGGDGMAGKKPAKQKKAKDLEIGKTKGAEAVKGGGSFQKTTVKK